jgi:hypothetical protein
MCEAASNIAGIDQRQGKELVLVMVGLCHDAEKALGLVLARGARSGTVASTVSMHHQGSINLQSSRYHQFWNNS